jgi:hypothetical protein
MIEIHLGAVDAKELPGITKVAEAADYIVARLAIRDALRTGQPLDIYVQNRLCDDWFWDLEKYPGVKLSREDPTLKLREMLHVPTLPPELDDSTIISALKLLDLPPPAEAVRDVSSWVLAHKLGAVWAIMEPSYSHLTDLLVWWSNHTVLDLIQPLTKRKTQGWIQEASGQLQAGYEAVMWKPDLYARFLCCWKALSGYNEQTREDWLRELGWYFPEVQWLVDKLGDLPLPDEANKLLSPKAEAYWRRRLIELDQGLAG